MKLSTRKIIGIEAAVVGLWLAVVFVPNAVLREYLQVGVLSIAILASWCLLGWARPRVHEGKLATALVILMALLFQVIWFVLFGLKLGFVHNIYIWNLGSIFKILLPIMLMIVGMEVLRGQVIAKGHENQGILVATVIIFTILEVIWSWSMYDLSSGQDVFELVMICAFPALLKNILMTYVAYQYDYRANIAYRMIMELPVMLLPILPNINNYLTVMFQAGLLVVLMLMLVKLHAQMQSKRTEIEKVRSDSELMWRHWLKYGIGGVLVLGLLVYVGLMSGIFRYHFLAVGSGSMEPNISRGDLILVEKTDQYDDMVEGEVLVYKHDNVVMVHRIREVRQDGEYSFITKGDANDAIDNWVVDQDDVIGLAKGKIIAVGYPTLWLNELFNGGKM